MKRIIVTLTLIASMLGALLLIGKENCYAHSSIMWQENGIPIRQGSEVEWSGSTVQIGEDKVLAVWTDTRTGFRAVMAQLYDKNGKIWKEDLFVGEQVYWDENDDSRNSYSNEGTRSGRSRGEPVVTKSSDGCVIVAWVKIKGWYNKEKGSIVVNKISEDGELLWSDGFVIPEARTEILNIVSNNEGGAFIAWKKHWNSNVFGIHLNASGEPYSEEWNETNGLELTQNTYSYTLSLYSDGDNGAVLAFQSPYNTIELKRISPFGEVLWSREIVETEDNNVARVAIARTNDGHFGLFYSLSDKEYMYRNKLWIINIDGEYMLSEPVLVRESSQVRTRNIHCINTSDNCFIVSWSEPSNLYSIYLQKIDLHGNMLWEETSLKLSGLDSYATYKCYLDEGKDSSKVTIAWAAGEKDSVNLFIHQAKAGKELVWEEESIQVADMAGWIQNYSINSVKSDLFVTWCDSRDSSYSIYYQVYDEDAQQLFTDNGELIYQGLSGSARLHSVIRNGDYIYIVWLEERIGSLNSQLMIQKIDSDGNTLFEDNGIIITHFDYKLYKGDISVVKHHSGGIAFTWFGHNENGSLIYAQAIGPNGDFLWKPDNGDIGIEVIKTRKKAMSTSGIITKKDDAYYVAWEWYDYMINNFEIKTQKIVDGRILWGEDGVNIISDDDRDSMIYLKQVLDGEYLFWEKEMRLPSEHNVRNQLYLLRINEDGTPAEGWDEGGLLICSRDSMKSPYRGQMGILTEGGVFTTWACWENDQPNDISNNFFAQLISYDGVIQWGENGIPITNNTNVFHSQPIVTLDDENYIYLALSQDKDIVAQKLDLEGNKLWGDQPITIVQSGIGNGSPTVTRSGNSVLITWRRSYRVKEWSDVRMQLLSAKTGKPVWDTGGVLISQFRYNDHLVATLDNDEAIIVWVDGRSSYDEFLEYTNNGNIYAQKVNLSSGVSVEEDIAVPQEAMCLYANYPNPFNPDTKISFNLSQNENVSLKVFNVKGQLVKTLLDEEYLESGKHIIIWDGKDNDGEAASSGIYFYRLEGEKESYTKKMALIK